MHSSEHNYEAVLEHVTWVQRLAYRLCADAAQAEDVSQESLLSAFRAPRRQGSALRAWLVGVVRNQARMAKRTSIRRQNTEAAALPPAEAASPAELVERLGTQRQVVKAVTELPEIYRTALLRRYFDDLGPREIADIEGVPEATIKTRLRRGLETLREQLANEFDDDVKRPSKLFAALAPIAGVELRRQQAAAASSTAAAGAASSPIRTVAWLTAGCAACTILAIGYRSLSGSEAATSTPAAAAATSAATSRASATNANTAPATAAPTTPDPADRARTARTRPRQDDSDVAANPNRAHEPMLVRVTAQDVHGLPAPALSVVASDFAERGEAPSARHRTPRVVGETAVDGTCTFRQQVKLTKLEAQTDGWTTVVAGTVFPYGQAAEVRIVVAREREIAGIVTDMSGAVIPGANIVYRSASTLGARIGAPLDQASRRSWRTTSDRSGSFRFENVPELPKAGLWIEAWDRESHHARIADRGDVTTTCSMRPLGPATRWIQGVVRSADGSTAAGAAVTLGNRTVLCDARGRFRLDAGRQPDADRIWATVRGMSPTASDRPQAGWPKTLELWVREPLRTISGRIVDSTGRARANVHVDIAAPTALAILPNPKSGSYRAVALEQLALGASTRVATDQHGRFELRGLADRSYTLVLRDPRTLAIASVGPFPADTHQLACTLPSPADTVRVAGFVSDEQGQPIRGAQVFVRHELASGAGDASASIGCQTDASGSFAFAQAMPRAARLSVSAGGSYTSIDFALREHQRPDDLRLALEPAGSFYLTQAAVDDSPPSDGFTLEDANGNAVVLQRNEGQLTFTIARGSFSGNRSPVYRAPVGTHVLVLWRRDKQIRRIVLDVRRGPPARIDV
ncbi:MAG: sigma-70 family RNA polymerase sigma factor [Planctomycetota bacterium]